MSQITPVCIPLPVDGAVRAAARALSRLPTVTPDPLVHVGDLDRPRARRHVSYEGTGLSVSTCPEDWAEIAALGDRKWTLTRRDGSAGRLVDLHALSSTDRATLDALAVHGTLLEPVTRWQIEYLNLDTDDMRVVLVHTEANALEEIAVMDYTQADGTPAVPVPIETVRAGDSLRRHWQAFFSGPLDDGPFAQEMAWLVLLEAAGHYDGVWWEDERDPVRLTAPRGAIFQSQLHAWTAQALEPPRPTRHRTLAMR